ncbi:hypothetical protein ACYPKM_35300 [Pseudomonas aeruginosa]
MPKNPPSDDVYEASAAGFDEILQDKACQQAAKYAQERALSPAERQALDEANAKALQQLFQRYGGHRRHRPGSP